MINKKKLEFFKNASFFIWWILFISLGVGILDEIEWLEIALKGTKDLMLVIALTLWIVIESIEPPPPTPRKFLK